MRRQLMVLVLLMAVVVAGCGGKFQLPTEHPAAKAVPSDKQYAMLQTWKGMDGIQDILLTQGKSTQLLMLFNSTYPRKFPELQTGPDQARGYVKLYPFSNPVPVDASYFPDLKTLFNPIALCAGRGASSAVTDRIFVLDLGDTCMAKFDIVRNTCEADPTPHTDTTDFRASVIRDYRTTWRVREYYLNNKAAQGDTISTFTDTTFAAVYGVAADAQGRVYVSGVAAVYDTSKIINNYWTRHFTYRIFRYERGPRYAGLVPDELNWDSHMPGAGWHRDTTWFVGTGTGTGFVTDPRGIVWSPLGSTSLLVADRGNKQAKTLSTFSGSTGYINFDGSEQGSPAPFASPEAVASDMAGFLYVVDRGNQNVVRYDQLGQYVQKVNVENNSDNLPLLDPVTVGVDDSVAYIGDRGRAQVIRYKRRP
jgi:hypothetical protein